MIIGFDGRYAEGNLVGVGKYIQYLVSGLTKRGVSCVLFYSRKPKYEIAGVKSVILDSPGRYYFEQIALPAALIKYKIDLYHAAGNIGIPLLCPAPAVLTVHDIIPLEIREYFSYSPLPFLSILSYNLRLRSSIFKASKIITVSNYVKNELVKKLKVSPRKIVTIYSGAPKRVKSGTLPKDLVDQEYILNNGGIDIRKNLEKLIEAFAVINLKFPKLKLVITGENPRARAALNLQVKKLGLKKSVIFTGYVDDNNLGAIINSAKLICYPTLSEGFGFPVLEGFAAGVPVVTSKTSSIPEVADNAAILVDPEDVAEIIEAIGKVLENQKVRKDLVLMGKIQYNKFSWENAINEYLNLYNRI